MATITNTGSQMDQGQTNSGLSTQIVIKVNNGKTTIGALQRFDVRQNRPLYRVKEIGTDGVIEIVPQSATEFEITASRVVFDQLRLPESLARGFRFINAQRVPFDIEVFDISSVDPAGGAQNSSSSGVVVMTYKNCWFTSYSTPYAADNYIITEEASIWAETAFISNLGSNFDIPLSGGIRGIAAQTDAELIERSVNIGNRRGALDASGIFNSLFS
mgnify:CR=1 FL=1